MDDDVRDYHADESLADGRPVTLRAIRPDDKQRVAAAFHGLERESIYARLFTHKDELTEADLRDITEIDFESVVGLVVTHGRGSDEVIIGSGRYFAFTTATGRRHAEVAFIVEEDYHGQGIAGMLLRHLTGIARTAGITAFVADVLPANAAMLRVFERTRMPMTRHNDGHGVQVTIDLADPAE
jgi:RimJ/RimL family protein N-acetyltransferase